MEKQGLHSVGGLAISREGKDVKVLTLVGFVGLLLSFAPVQALTVDEIIKLKKAASVIRRSTYGSKERDSSRVAGTW